MEKIDINDFYSGWDIMLLKKNTLESEKYLKSFLDMADRYNDLPGIIAVCNEMGGFYRAIGRLEEAKTVYGRVLGNLQLIGQNANENYGVALINYGNVFISNREYTEALNIYNKAVEILNRLRLDKDYRMAALCNNISAIYRELGRLDEAEEAAEKSLQIIEEIPDAVIEVATSCINLGEVLIAKQAYALARENLTKAIDIFMKETDGQDTHLAAAIAAMGALEYKTENYMAAEYYYEEALKLIERDFGRTAYYELTLQNLEKVRLKTKSN